MEVIRIKPNQLGLIRSCLPPELFELAAQGAVSVLAAAESGAVRAVTVVSAHEGTGQILYAATAEDQRERGLFTYLLNAFLWEAADAGLSEVSCTLTSSADCLPVERALIAAGFGFAPEEARLFRSTLGDFLRAPLPDGDRDAALSLLPLGTLSPAQHKTLCAELPFFYSPHELDGFDAGLSAAAFAGGRLAGAILLRADEDGLELPCLYAAPGTPRATGELLSYAARAARERKLPPDTPLCIAVVSPAAEKLVLRLLPDAEACGTVRMTLPLLAEKGVAEQ